MKNINQIEQLTKTIELLATKVEMQNEQIANLKVRGKNALPTIELDGLSAKEKSVLARNIARQMKRAKYKNFVLKAERIVRGTNEKPVKVSQLKRDGSCNEFDVKTTRYVIGIYDKESNEKIRESVWH